MHRDSVLLKIASYVLWVHMDIGAGGAAGSDGSGTRRRFSLAATAFCAEKLGIIERRRGICE